jgi:phage-related protein
MSKIVDFLSKYLYHKVMKKLVFQGSSLEDLREFPAAARNEAGYQLDKVQHGLLS